jgi:sarcosine oxidase subunit beta
MAVTADAVVIGAGIMGVSAAYHLTQRGVGKIVVLEREGVAAGSTGRSGGGIRHQFSDPVGLALTRRSLQTFESFRDLFGVELGIERCGYLYIVQTEAQRAAFARNVTMQREQGLQVELLDADEIGRRFPYLSTEGVLGGTYCPEDCASFPREANEAMARRVGELGVALEIGQEVVAVLTDGGKVNGVRTGREEYRAPVVVNAAGPWAGEIGKLAGIEVPVVPRPRHEFGTTAFPRDLVPETPYILDPAGGFSLRREGESLVFGTTPDRPPGFDVTPDPSLGPPLQERVSRRCPALAGAALGNSRVGLLEVTPDHHGIISGAAGLPGFYVLAGFSGHGFMHAPAVGELLAELIVDGQASTLDISSFDLGRFARGGGQVDPTSPFGGGGHAPD